MEPSAYFTQKAAGFMHYNLNSGQRAAALNTISWVSLPKTKVEQQIEKDRKTLASCITVLF